MTLTDPESVVRQASAERVERTRTIALKLAELTLLNTARSRARCDGLATEMIALLRDEDAYQRSRPAAAPRNQHEEAVQRLSEVLEACRDARDQAELARHYSMSERIHRKKDDGSR